MSATSPPPLPFADRALLRVAVAIVPRRERDDWMRCWEAELWHRRHRRAGRMDSAADLYPGVFRDSLWLRHATWERAMRGTALLCVLLLGVTLVASLLPLWRCLGGLQELREFVSASALRFLSEAGLVTLVGFATSGRAVKYKAGTRQRSRLGTQVFAAAKMLLLLLTVFALSEDVTRPFYVAHCFTAEVVQPQLFVVLALLALRWSFEDGENRCKHCLRLLAAPARVGLPSRNFLESNGTERICRDGHGLLSVPEIETSWRSSSYWIAP